MIPIRVISLDRSTARKREFVEMNQGLAYEFHRATDGDLLTDQELQDERHFIQPLDLTSRGAYGCALSHLSLWNHVIETAEPLTIAEDDAVFRHDFQERSHAMLAKLPADWDIILWGWNFDAILGLKAMPGVSTTISLFDQAMLRENLTLYRNSSDPSFIFELELAFGLPAYTISPSGARRFKRACFPMTREPLAIPKLGQFEAQRLSIRGIDHALNKLYGSHNAFVSFAPLVVTKNDSELSTIRNGRTLR